uniref:Reverse transcriptase domain-containing protein n=1 Tax=Tanacetum cinerariifolium TaxID=118510 RepID=A0A6L2MUU7_TANCI|nr:reverse transcriptase domain-containing protein [Tanacetum cinerariifolium]
MRKFENQPKDNRMPPQPPFKKSDVSRAYTIRATERKAYAGNLPYYNKCKLHHVRPCTVKCVQTSSALASFFLSRGNLSSLAVGKSSGSGNSSLAVGMP